MITAAILIGLAGYRLASLLINEDGPFEIFAKLRAEITPDPGLIKPWEVEAVKLFECIWCMSVWTCLLFALLWLIEPWLVIPFSAMSIVLFVNKFID